VIKNIFISGVGGQGVLTISSIITSAALVCGYDAKKSEVHGMAQRGGSVVSQVRYGDKIYSPLIRKGDADILIAFEKLEALRYIDWIKKDGVCIVNDQRILPATYGEKAVPYPENIQELLEKRVARLIFFPAMQLAKELGNVRAANVIMLGTFWGFAPELDLEAMKKGIAETVPPKFLELNIKAFEKGLEYAKGK
jgi:indolepyruvate ferredoxin oxidoreductase, beta subunit